MRTRTRQARADALAGGALVMNTNYPKETT